MQVTVTTLEKATIYLCLGAKLLSMTPQKKDSRFCLVHLEIKKWMQWYVDNIGLVKYTHFDNRRKRLKKQWRTQNQVRNKIRIL